MALTIDSNGDNLTNLVNILTEKWDSSNTDNATPVIKRIMDLTTPSKKDYQQADFVLLYDLGRDEEYIDLGSLNIRVKERFSIDIRTINGRARLIKLYKEVRRLLWSYRKDPTDDSSDRFPFHIIKPLSRRDLSDKRKPLQHMVYDIEVKTMVQAVSTS